MRSSKRCLIAHKMQQTVTVDPLLTDAQFLVPFNTTRCPGEFSLITW